MPITREEIAGLEWLETASANLCASWRHMVAAQEYMAAVCDGGLVVKGAEAAELLLLIEDAMKELDAGWLMVREERARGTKATPPRLLFVRK